VGFVTGSLQVNVTGAMLDSVVEQINDQLVHAGAVQNAGQLSRQMHVNLHIGERGAYFIGRTLKDAPNIPLGRRNWKCVAETRPRENKKIIDHFLDADGTVLQILACPDARSRQIFVL
jgi:hypothetical protein